jgi:DNA-directed RNA polymerase specialized sigma24 family protein
LDQEAFDKLLAWLDADRERAGAMYEKIRFRLIRIFGSHGCAEPEALADETIDRVILKIDRLVDNYVGDPTRYFIGVARKVLLEELRDRARRRVAQPPDELWKDDQEEREYACLDKCMAELPDHNRHVVLAYYEGERHEKIVNRRKLAEELGITLRALRLRAFHIRLELRECMELCLTQNLA